MVSIDLGEAGACHPFRHRHGSAPPSRLLLPATYDLLPWDLLLTHAPIGDSGHMAAPWPLGHLDVPSPHWSALPPSPRALTAPRQVSRGQVKLACVPRGGRPIWGHRAQIHAPTWL